MITELREYQLRGIEALRQSIRNGHRSICFVLPTGGGKTACATAILRMALAKKAKRALFVAHRRELVSQAAQRLDAEGFSSLRVIQASRVDGPEDAAVTVASIPTLIAKKWRDRLPPADIVIFDEAHHVKAKTWESLFRQYSQSFVIGLTATPARSDGKALGDVFTDLVVCSSVKELTEQRYLVPCLVKAPERRLGPRTIAKTPIAAYLEHCPGKRTVVFVPTIAGATETAETFSQAGFQADVVHCKLPAKKRADLLAAFRAGTIRVLVNAMVLTEGWDDPGVEVAILTRSCTHASIYLQIVGRILRPHTDKSEAILIDLRGVVHEHGAPDADRIYSLTGKPITQKKSDREATGGGGGPQEPIAGNYPLYTISYQGSTREERRAFFDRLAETAALRNYKKGKDGFAQWAWHQFCRRYGRAAWKEFAK